MNVHFDWNEMEFRAVVDVCGDPTEDGEFMMEDLFIIDGESEINASGLFLNASCFRDLEEAAFDAWTKEMER